MKGIRRLLAVFRFPIVLLFIAPMILALPVLVGGALYYGTPSLQFVPWRSWAWDVLREGHLPLWNPWIGMGAPLAANYQTALYYPPNWSLMVIHWIGGVAAHAWAQTLVVAAHWIWAGVGMAALARQMKLNPLAQTATGLSFGLSSYLVAKAGFLSINAAVAWLPWVILFTDRISRIPVSSSSSRGNRPWIGLAVCLGFQLLAGHAQLAWYTLLLAWIWFLATAGCYGWRPFWARSQKMILACLFGFGLAAIQLIPTAEYLLQSQRSTEVEIERALTYSLLPWKLITLLAPNFFGNPAHGNYWHNVYYWEDAIYIGLLPVVLGASHGLVSAVRSIRQKQAFAQESNRLSILLIGIALTGIILALGRYLPIYSFLYRHIPTFDMFQAPGRFAIWTTFAFTLLAGMAVHGWCRPQGRGLYWTRLATAGAFAVMVGAGFASVVLADVKLTFIRAAAMAGVWGLGMGILALLAPRSGEPRPRIGWNWAVAAWIALDLLVAGWGLNPSAPLHFYREEASTGGYIEERLEDQRLYLPEKDEYTLKFERFFPVENYGDKHDLQALRSTLLPNLTMLDKVYSANNFDPLVPRRYQRWTEYLNTRSSHELTAWLGWMNVGMVEYADPTADEGVRFESVQAQGRFRWSTCATYVNGEADAWATLTRKNPTGQGETVGGPVVIESTGMQADEACSPATSGGISIIRDSPDRVILQTNTNRPGWLVQADMWYPGWTAEVDGKRAALHPADYLFRGVYVPAGSHRIVIEYRPMSFRIGFFGTVLSALLLALILRKVVMVSRIG